MKTNTASHDAPFTRNEGIRFLIRTCRSDWAANPGNTKVRAALVLYRISSWSLSLPRMGRRLLFPVRTIYKVAVGWIIGIDIPPETVIGPGLRIMHGTGLVVHGKSKIGHDCTLRHGVTLGIRGVQGKPDGPPTLGNNVNVGAGAQILGPIMVSDGAIVGAGSVVLKSVPTNATVVGNPARQLHRT
ncbi:hypothetical protein [Pseudarthrobacter sp. lyk4-40-TYG-27]|uniref:serine O-acetyltransferase n=1 Tax=Pseudarthrobacter sp. lyk4-40-TYG-27 TaxID=3040305 RepID=UPI00330631BD